MCVWVCGVGEKDFLGKLISLLPPGKFINSIIKISRYKITKNDLTFREQHELSTNHFKETRKQ